VKGGVPKDARTQVLAEAGKQYALYLTQGGKADLRLTLPAGRYSVQWIDPVSGKPAKNQALDHPGGEATLSSPEFAEDIALKIATK
jgi:hypothetical protein